MGIISYEDKVSNCHAKEKTPDNIDQENAKSESDIIVVSLLENTNSFDRSEGDINGNIITNQISPPSMIKSHGNSGSLDQEEKDERDGANPVVVQKIIQESRYLNQKLELMKKKKI